MLVALDAAAAREFSAAGLGWSGLYVISGYRSAAAQARINPDNPASKHSWCPSVAVDLRVANLPASTTPVAIWAKLGEIWQRMGGRWGGFFPTPDLNHFELPV